MKLNMQCETLSSENLFREGQSIYIHKSSNLPSYIGKLHKHDFIEITYVISGECSHIEYNKEFPIKKGDLFIINYGVPHANIQKPDSTEPFLAYDCAFKPDYIDKALISEHDFLKLKSSFLFESLFHQSNPTLPNLHLTESGFFEFERLMSNMYNEFEKQEKGYYDILRAYLIELIIKIFRDMDNSTGLTLKSKQEYYINLAIQYIESNYMKKISLNDIAYRSFLSKSYFSQLFKEITGLCFSDYLQKVRVKKACELLTSSGDSIQNIAEKVGFTDMKFFYSTFKKHVGEVPGEYRKEHS